MVRQLPSDTTPAIIYPNSDGQLIADSTNNLEIFSPSGEQFLTFVELAQLREPERQRAEAGTPTR